MCEFCDNSFVNREHASDDYYIHKPLPLRNSHNHKRIKADGHHPMMYLKEYRPSGSHIWAIVCEFNDDNGTVVEIPAIYCPRCGDKLVGKETIFPEDKNT